MLTALHYSDNWAHEQLSKMSLDEKIGQLMILRVPAQNCELCMEEMLRQIQLYQPGGVCFFRGSPANEIMITNRLQQASKIPMLISIDGEWGPAMRLDSCLPFPRQMTLGAIDKRYDTLIYRMGYEVGRQCLALGIHLNFAPDVDINNNSKNPVIGNRSFGENRELLTRKALLYMRGMQDAGLLTCLKHFPGHGDCVTDSHKSLPVIKKSREALDKLELYPFKQLIQQGADMVMVGHLNVPALDAQDSSIAILSYPIVTELLKEEMGFKGIIITDAMEMRGLREYYPLGGEAEIRALLAGIDILLLPENLDVVIPAIKQAIDSGRISEELINERCLRVLQLKQKAGLQKVAKISVSEAYKQINTPEQQELLHQLAQKALTLIKNEDKILPLNPQEVSNVALLAIDGIRDSTQLRALAKQYNIAFVQHDRMIRKNEHKQLDRQLLSYETVIVTVLSSGNLSENYGVLKEFIDYLEHISTTKEIILVINGNPYSLSHFGTLNHYKAVIIAYQPAFTFVETAMESIFGYANFEGKLPVTAGRFERGHGISLIRDGMDCSTFNCSWLPQSATHAIDSMVNKAINLQVIPGCQIVAAQNGRLLFAKSYGHLTYDTLRPQPTTLQTLYDVASVTKAAATTLALMKLYDETRFKLTDSIGSYLPFLIGSNKHDITVKELLTHTSGLKVFIPFYRKIAPKEGWNRKVLSETQNEEFPTEIAANVYLRKGYDSLLLHHIAQSPLGPKHYVYSDLNFILLKEIIENLSDMPLDRYLDSFFYKPMGLTDCGFNPLTHNIDKQKIAPTEIDNTFRRQMLQGYVHDQTAALFGGVSGNAGLFCSANDLVQIFQMLLNGGFYNGKRYLSEETVKLFTTTCPLHNCKRRALGFDTPNFDKKSEALPSKANRHTFGHQGFTGTVVWCDPMHNLVYVFLSNRIYPNVEPNKLAKSGLRTKVMEIILDSLSD
jgi:beta-glucosidase-like glycosyl hydrolase/CubicO group peptidase (beta-lactamase class C family)